MVSFMSQPDWAMGALIFSQTLLWMYLWGCFGMRSTSELVHWVKQIALWNMGSPYSMSQRAKQNKNSTLKEENSSYLTAFKLGHLFIFLPLDSPWNNTSFWVFTLMALRWELHNGSLAFIPEPNHWLSRVSSLRTPSVDHGTFMLP